MKERRGSFSPNSHLGNTHNMRLSGAISSIDVASSDADSNM